MRQKAISVIFLAVGMLLLSSTSMIAGENGGADQQGEMRSLPLREFIDLSVQKDTEFERILIDELSLQYEKDLELPAGDLVREVKAQYDFSYVNISFL